jgi:integrase
MMKNAIIKQGARILPPDEYRQIRANLKTQHQVLLDGLLCTGMRGEEFWRFIKNPQWFDSDRMVIHLPKGASLKLKARQKERDIHLSNWGLMVIERLFDRDLRRISRIAWRGDLIRGASRAGVDTRAIVPKMTRKTWESWLVASYPLMTVQIALSQGHNSLTAMEHYLNISFSPIEKEEMKKFVNGFCGISI